MIEKRAKPVFNIDEHYETYTIYFDLSRYFQTINVRVERFLSIFTNYLQLF